MISDTEIKTCNKCSHVLGKRFYTDTWEKWQCGHKENYKGTTTHPVSGEQQRIFITENIMEIRLFKCQGNWFEEYIRPEPIPSINGTTAKLFDAPMSNEDLVKNREAAAKKIAEIKLRKQGLSNIKADEL